MSGSCLLEKNICILMEIRLDQSVSITFTFVNYIYLLCLCIEEYKEIMSKKFHLYTCIFRIHWFDSKFLGTDDLNFLILFIILICQDMLSGSWLLPAACLRSYSCIYEADVQYFFNQIDGYIHIIAYLFGTDNFLSHRDCYLDFLSFFFNT